MTLQMPRKSPFVETSNLLRIRAGIAGQLMGGFARAAFDADRLRELWHRLQDYNEYDRLRSATAAPRKTFELGAPDFVPGSLLVTSHTGLYLLEPDGWHCLLPIRCFGIARHEDKLFVGAYAGLHSFVLSARILGKAGIDGLRDFQVVAKYETRYFSERIHQITYDPQAQVIHCANCRRNSLLTVDAGGRGIVDEKFLFVDPTGSPFWTDQNHINSVTVNGESLLFAARYAGSGAGLGFVANDTVRVYQYPARGVHDVLIHDGAIMFSDSFREGGAEQKPEVCGAVRFRGEEYLSQAIEAGSRKLVLRGLAKRDNWLAVGYSAYARNREERLARAGGGVIVFRDDKMLGFIDGPLGQVHDILPVDGVRTDAAGPALSAGELDAMFRRDVGPLIFEAPLLRNAGIPSLR
jgi:hypothetical protein